jgi:hypothetical protein
MARMDIFFLEVGVIDETDHFKILPFCYIDRRWMRGRRFDKDWGGGGVVPRTPSTWFPTTMILKPTRQRITQPYILFACVKFTYYPQCPVVVNLRKNAF